MIGKGWGGRGWHGELSSPAKLRNKCSPGSVASLDGPPEPGYLARWPPTRRRRCSPPAGDRLADELYDLRCDLANPDLMLTVEQAAAMQDRVDALGPLVGEHLQQMLAAED